MFAFAAAGRRALARELSRIAELAPWLSDGELHDLACQAGRAVAGPGQVRAGLVANGQDELARLAKEAVALLPGLRQHSLVAAPGIAMSDDGRGRVALLFPGEGGSLSGPASATTPAEATAHDPATHPAVVAASLANLRWLDELGLKATAAVGHGLGEITALVWAGCLAEADAARLVTQRAAVLAAPSAEQTALVCVDADGPTAQRLCEASGLVVAAYNGPRCHVLAGPVAAALGLARRLAGDGIPARLLDSPQDCYSRHGSARAAAMGSVVREFSFQPPSRRLISTITGAELTADGDLGSMLCSQLTSPVAFAPALEVATADADLLIETGPGQELSRLAADCSDVPALSLAAGRADQDATARAAAALFASGAVPTLAPLFDASPARPIDIWRERVFIPSPCGTAPPRGTTAADRVPTGDAEERTAAGDPATAGGATGPGGGAGAPAAPAAAEPGATTGGAGQQPAARVPGPAPQPSAGPPSEATPNATAGPAASSGSPAGTASQPVGQPAGPASRPPPSLRPRPRPALPQGTAARPVPAPRKIPAHQQVPTQR